jgi:hypothetical protein
VQDREYRSLHKRALVDMIEIDIDRQQSGVEKFFTERLCQQRFFSAIIIADQGDIVPIAFQKSVNTFFYEILLMFTRNVYHTHTRDVPRKKSSPDVEKNEYTLTDFSILEFTVQACNAKKNNLLYIDGQQVALRYFFVFFTGTKTLHKLS